MAEHRQDRTQDHNDIEPRQGGRETFPQQARRSHEDGSGGERRAQGRRSHEDGSGGERRAQGRWRFSSAVEAARHLGSDR